MRILLAEDDGKRPSSFGAGWASSATMSSSVDNGPDALQMLFARNSMWRSSTACCRRLDGLSVFATHARRRHRGAGPAADRARPDRGPGLRGSKPEPTIIWSSRSPFPSSLRASTRSSGADRCRPRPRASSMAAITMDLLQAQGVSATASRSSSSRARSGSWKS